MDNSFIEKLKLFLTETGYKGKIHDIDFSFLSENKEFVEWVLNTSPEDFVYDQELELAEKMKKEGKFINSEQELDEILLKDYACDVNGECISEYQILLEKDKISEIDDNINMLNQLNEFSKKQYDILKIEMQDSKKYLSIEESKMNAVVAKYASYDQKFITFLRDVNNEYKSYKDLFEYNFLNKEGNSQHFKPPQEFIIECVATKNDITRYINKCHKYSSIPVSNMNNTSVMCDSVICSSLPSESDIIKFRDELSALKMSINKKLFNKIILEGKEKALVSCLKYLKEENIDSNLMCLLFDQKNDEDTQEREGYTDTWLVEHIKNECLKYTECQIIYVLNDLYESKIISRNEKLLAIDKFSDVIRRFCAIIDFTWLMCKTNNELFDNYHSHIASIANSLSHEFKEHLQRKTCMENIIQDVLPVPNLLSELRPSVECIESLLIPINMSLILSSSARHNNILEAMDCFKDLMKKAEDQLLENLKKLLESSVARYKDCLSMKKEVFDDACKKNTKSRSCNIKTIVNNIESVIHGLNDKITSETSKCISMQECMLQSSLQNKHLFLWVTFLTEPEKLKV